MIRMSVYGINVIIETDDPSVKALLEFTTKKEEYNFFLRRVTESKVHGKIYNRKHTDVKTKHIFFEVGIGWVTYLINIFGKYLFKEDLDGLYSAILQPTYRNYPFQELWNDQNDDILHVLKYKFGLFSVYTGYGKTSCIACLAKYFSQDCGKKVLLVTPNAKPQDELVKRINEKYGLVVAQFGEKRKKSPKGGNLQCIMTQGFMARSEVKDPNEWVNFETEFKSFDVVLADEVEYCINPSGELIFSTCSNAQCRYGFSGTADKARGEMINFKNGLEDPAVNGNLDLIKFFGPSLIYRKPLNKEIDLITVKTRSLDKIDVKDIDNNNLYLNTMTRIFTDPSVCNIICNIAKKFSLLFIPVNNLENIINNWIDTYWKGKFRILLVCGSDNKKGGYFYYDLQGNKTEYGLAEACQLIRDGKVDVIPSTASGFRALDLPNLKNILIFAGKIGGSVLQQIGRVAREPHMNIISIAPYGQRKIPIFTKGADKREELIRNYYMYCTITDVTIKEDDLPNYNGIV